MPHKEASVCISLAHANILGIKRPKEPGEETCNGSHSLSMPTCRACRYNFLLTARPGIDRMAYTDNTVLARAGNHPLTTGTPPCALPSVHRPGHDLKQFQRQTSSGDEHATVWTDTWHAATNPHGYKRS